MKLYMMKKPKIIFWDIETSPLIGTAWEVYEANILDVLKDSELLCFSYKEPGKGEVVTERQAKFNKDSPSDKHVVKALHAILSEADLVVAHNGDAFDMKKANNRFLYYGLPPLPPIASVDTKKAAKRYFGFTSNSLQDLARYLGLGSKLKHTGYDMWRGCMANKKSAWKLMVKYNRQDVVLLEKVYNALKPHIKNHPRTSLLEDKHLVCECGSENLQKRGFRLTRARKVQRYQCQDCGAWL